MSFLNKNIDVYAFILAFIIYLSTISGFPNYISYAIIVIIGYFNFYENSVKKKLNNLDYYLIIFVIISVVIFYYGKAFDKQIGNNFIDWERSVEFFPFTIFLLGTIFFSKRDNSKIMKYLLLFIIVESVVAVFEFLLGVPYILTPSNLGETEFGETSLLYYNRVYGLSPNVSLLAQKIMSGIILLFYLRNIKYKNIMILFLLVVLVISFGRTAILSIIIFLICYFFFYIKSIKWKYKLLVFCLCLVLFIIISQRFEAIINQVFRGRSGFDVSGRDNIFLIYLNYIKENIFFGNLFEKVFILLSGKSYHAHNSYLQMIATIGVLPFIFFLVYLFKIIRKNILIFLLPIFVFSFSQYGIFWGCSFLDILFYTIIFNQVNNVSKI